MADNIDVTPGTGATVHADEYTHTVLGLGKSQVIKIADGAMGGETPLRIVAEDVASAGGESGILAMGIRKDVPAALGADLDFTYPLFDSTGKQWVSGVYPEDTASANLDPIMVVGAKRLAVPANSSGTDGDYEPLQMDAGKLWVKPLGDFVTCSTDVTRPANTTTYTVNDALADTTPTSGGFTFTSAARISGGSGIITDLIVSFDEDAATPLQGELFIFDTSVTAITDNAAFAITDAESRTIVAKIPFALEDNGNNGFYHAQNLNIGFTAVGSANLRFLVKVKNGYVPTTNSSVITFRLKVLQVN